MRHGMAAMILILGVVGCNDNKREDAAEPVEERRPVRQFGPESDGAEAPDPRQAVEQRLRAREELLEPERRVDLAQLEVNYAQRRLSHARERVNLSKGRERMPKWWPTSAHWKLQRAEDNLAKARRNLEDARRHLQDTKAKLESP